MQPPPFSSPLRRWWLYQKRPPRWVRLEAENARAVRKQTAPKLKRPPPQEPSLVDSVKTGRPAWMDLPTVIRVARPRPVMSFEDKWELNRLARYFASRRSNVGSWGAGYRPYKLKIEPPAENPAPPADVPRRIGCGHCYDMARLVAWHVAPTYYCQTCRNETVAEVGEDVGVLAEVFFATKKPAPLAPEAALRTKASKENVSLKTAHRQR